MADVRYWVGGTGSWTSGGSTAHWSATSGGSSGASAPTETDVVIFDNNSGTGTVSCYAAWAYCYELIVSGSGALTLSGSMGIHNSARLSGSKTTSGLTLIYEADGALTTDLVLGGLNIGGRTVEITDYATINNIDIGDSGSLILQSTYTLTAPNGIDGPATGVGYVYSVPYEVQASIDDSSGNNTMERLGVRDIAFGGGATWYKGAGFVDSGNNTGLSALPTVSGLFLGDF